MKNTKKIIATALAGFSVWWPSWPPPGCNLDGPIGSTFLCAFPPAPPINPPAFPPGGRVCPLVLKPVCGINGVTYDNSCFAYPVPVWHDGPCFAPTPVPLPTPRPPFPPPIPTFTPLPPPPPIFRPLGPRIDTICDPNTGFCIPVVAPAS